MNTVKFTIDEVIAIVMSEVDSLEAEMLYGLQNEELDLPMLIQEKLNKMSGEYYTDFINEIEEMSKDILHIKTGELNELNRCHEEIAILAEENLQDYLEL